MREAREALERAIDALTDEIEAVPPYPGGTPLLRRSCAMELRRIGSMAGTQGHLLRAIAHSIDEALLAITEAQRVLQAVQA
jgi:hypothetical protein